MTVPGFISERIARSSFPWSWMTLRTTSSTNYAVKFSAAARFERCKATRPKVSSNNLTEHRRPGVSNSPAHDDVTIQ